MFKIINIEIICLEQCQAISFNKAMHSLKYN